MAKVVRGVDDYKKEFLSIFNSLCGRHGRWEVWSDFIQLTAIDISNVTDKGNAPKRAADARNIAKKYSEDEIIRTNPMNKIDNIKFKREKEKALTDMEIEMMRQACQTTMQKAIMEMLLSTGCRAAELVSIKIADMDEDKVSILGKGGKWRTVYINAKAFVAIKNYLADRKDTNPYLFPREINTKDRTMISNFSRKDWFKDPRLVTKADHFGRDSVNNMVRTIGKRAGVKGVHTHRFRRTCATQALRHGMPIELVSMMLGHEQISTTQIYLDIRDDDLQAAHRKYVV